MSVPLANVPEINRLARFWGDASSLAKNPIPVQRLANRGVGRAAGKVFGAVNSRFGFWGMIATAQFFATLKTIVELQTAQAEGHIHIGSAVRYAAAYHNGSPTTPARPFLKKAIEETPIKASRSRRTPKSFRGGLYQGQKYIDDAAGFFRGDVSRLARRSAGQQIAGFFWGSLRIGAETRRPNVLLNYAKRVARNARKNVKQMGEDTGTLRASIAIGFSSEEMSQESQKHAMIQMRKKGIEGEIHDRLYLGTVPAGAGGITGTVRM